jgi:hypothetical protein
MIEATTDPDGERSQGRLPFERVASLCEAFTQDWELGRPDIPSYLDRVTPARRTCCSGTCCCANSGACTIKASVLELTIISNASRSSLVSSAMCSSRRPRRLSLPTTSVWPSSRWIRSRYQPVGSETIG